MLTDPFDQQLADLLKAARPGPPPGWRSQALAALAGVRPRRHPNLLTYIIVAALILLLAAGLFAAVRHIFFVEGTLYFVEPVRPSADGAPDRRARVFSGELQWETDGPLVEHFRDISPDGEWVVFATETGTRPYDGGSELLISKLDGSEQINLSEIAGLSGINCRAKWSPDGTMIAFQHAEPLQGMFPCEAGWSVWLIRSDGSYARPLLSEGAPDHKHPTWSADGTRLLLQMGSNVPGEEGGMVATDIWGEDIEAVPNVGSDAAWSPDGSMIVSIQWEQSELDGKPGQWNQLLLTNADGSDPRVLVEQFVAKDDVRKHLDDEELPGADPVEVAQVSAGPMRPAWSPNGNQIAFVAALPFDPDGPYVDDQLEVWVYDLTTDELIQITDDDISQKSIIWK